MKRQSTREGLRSDFRELAARLDQIHTEWQDASSRDDADAKTRLIEEEIELLAKIDGIVKEFRDYIASRT